MSERERIASEGERAGSEQTERQLPGMPDLDQLRHRRDGAVLRARREELGLSLAETAERARMPMQLLRDVERGERMDEFYLDQILRLLSVLDMELVIGS
jgi:ribosome-binding protein aMBF1 (putative translation factor)